MEDVLNTAEQPVGSLDIWQQQWQPDIVEMPRTVRTHAAVSVEGGE